MKLEIECKKCGAIQVADAWVIIKAIMDSAERSSIWSGCLCEHCAKNLDTE